MKTDASERLAALLKIEKPDVGYETEQALELAANEIEHLRTALVRIILDGGPDDAKTRNDCAEIAHQALMASS